MISTWLRPLQRALRAAATITLVALVAACGGGGTLPESDGLLDRRPLPAAMLTGTAVNYSPYRSATRESELANEVITAANLEQDLRLLLAADIDVIRVFSSRAFSARLLEVIRSQGLPIKVMLGAYVNPPSSPAAEADNQAELAECVRLANLYSDIVQAVSVGNETMVSWSTHKVDPVVMAGYLRQVRTAVTQPVTTDDNWAFWASAPKVITDVVDFASVHTYAMLDTYFDPTLWDWRQKGASDATRAAAMMDAALAETRRQFGQARAFFDRIGLGALPMVVGETGWTAVDVAGGPVLPYRVHPVNQKMYFDRLQAWAQEARASGSGPQAIFYFEAFDETWKGGDDGWGLFNKDRQARYVLKDRGACGVTWTCEAGTATYTEADAVRWTAPTVNPEVTATRYTLFADAITAGELRPTGLRWDPFANTGYGSVANAAPGDSPTGFEINPAPLDYGWGLFHYSAAGVTENLSAFAGGHLNFWLRTNGYPGRLEIGLSTDTDDRDVQEAYVAMAPGQYGYCNDDRWCQVSIPLSAFVAANPKIDLRLVSFRFIIADRYAFTGNVAATPKPKIYIDNLHWAR